MERIAFISLMNGFPWGGSEELWYMTACHAINEGHSVGVSVKHWTNTHSNIKNLMDKESVVNFRGAKNSLLHRGIRKFFRTNEIVSFVNTYQPKILCISQGDVYSILHHHRLVDLLLKSKIPYSLICQYNNEHQSLPYRHIEKARKVFAYAENVLFVASRNLQTVERQLAMQLPNARIVHNPVKVTDSTLSLSLTRKPNRLACVARLDCNYKGQDILLQALASDFWKNEEWVLNLYGRGVDEQYLKDLVNYYQLESRVFLKGFVKDIEALWQCNDILILPSIGEGTPLSLIEAMVCRRPAIATDVGDNAVFVKEEKTGFLAEAPTVRLLNKAIRRAWEAREKWHILGEKARQHALGIIDLTPERTLLDIILNRQSTRYYDGRG